MLNIQTPDEKGDSKSYPPTPPNHVFPFHGFTGHLQLVPYCHLGSNPTWWNNEIWRLKMVALVGGFNPTEKY